jgi:hypothetical protein
MISDTNHQVCPSKLIWATELGFLSDDFQSPINPDHMMVQINHKTTRIISYNRTTNQTGLAHTIQSQATQEK